MVFKYLVMRADGSEIGDYSWMSASDIGEAEDICHDVAEDATLDDPQDFVIFESQGWKEVRIVTVPEPEPAES